MVLTHVHRGLLAVCKLALEDYGASGTPSPSTREIFKAWRDQGPVGPTGPHGGKGAGRNAATRWSHSSHWPPPPSSIQKLAASWMV